MYWTNSSWRFLQDRVRRWVLGAEAVPGVDARHGEKAGPTAAVSSDADELQDLYDQAPCAYFSLDEAGRFLRLNAKALHWLGCTSEEALAGLRPEDFLSEESRGQFAECFAVLCAHGQVEGLEFDLVGRPGVRRRVSLAATAVFAATGALQQVRCVLHDITELMRAKTRLQALAAEQRAILDNDLVGIIKLNGSRTVWKNRTVETMFGYAPGELRSQTARVL